jgi:hypothetical protein
VLSSLPPVATDAREEKKELKVRFSFEYTIGCTSTADTTRRSIFESTGHSSYMVPDETVCSIDSTGVFIAKGSGRTPVPAFSRMEINTSMS